MFGNQAKAERLYLAGLNLLRRASPDAVWVQAKLLARRVVLGILGVNLRAWRVLIEHSRVLRRLHARVREAGGPVAVTVLEMIGENARLLEKLTVALPREAALKARNAVVETDSRLTQAIASALGLDWYLWQTREDVRVRMSHRRVNRVLVNWHDPPSPESLLGTPTGLGHYNAGCAPNCRCIPIPIARLSDVNWPHRVYFNGQIHSLTLAQFRSLAGPSILR